MDLLETERLAVRHFEYEDAPFILRLLNEPSFLRNIGDKGVRTIEDARGYLADGPMASYARHGFGLWCVSLKDTGSPIGMCGLIKREILEDVDLGYALVPEAEGRGYAFEAAAAVMAHAREAFGLKRLAAVVDSDNERSIRLLGRLGFRLERMVLLVEDAPEIELYLASL